MNSHRFDICHYPDNFTNVSVHFNENGHTPSDFSFASIDKVEAEWPRLLKENYLMHGLNSIYFCYYFYLLSLFSDNLHH